MTDTAYCEVIDVARITGLYNQVVDESVGTGDAVTSIFAFDNKNIIDGSEQVYIAGSLKTKNTDYTLNNYSGSITFLSIPANGAAITANYKYFPDTVNITSDDITPLIQDASAEVEDWTGKKYTSGNSVTESLSGRAEKITVQGSKGYGQYHSETQQEKYIVLVSHYPVQSITSLQWMDTDGTVDDTLVENTDFQWWPDGRIQIMTSSIPVGLNRKMVKATYTYGYSSVPRNVKELTAVIAGIMVCVNITGGSFDDVSSFTLGPETAANEGNDKTIIAALDRLEKMRDRLFEQIGKEMRTVVL